MGSDPDGQIWGQLILIVLLTLINAGFAAAEIAVVSSSRARMQAQADKGDRKAAKLVAIMKDSSHFWLPFKSESPLPVSLPRLQRRRH